MILNDLNELTISAPGRICLFGEHQDYLGLPVITAAINLRISIHGSPRNDRKFVLSMPDIGDEEIIDPAMPVLYDKERDYFKSSLNVLKRHGVKFNNGYDCTITGNIPINSGTSSSSALIVAWIKFLLTVASDSRVNDPYNIARLAHEAEVLEFNEPGGMMDHFACSFGSILYIDFSKPDGYEPVNTKPGKFVLGDSMQPKDTKGILHRVKDGTLNALSLLQRKDQHVNIHTIDLKLLERFKKLLNSDQYNLLFANINNREFTQQARAELSKDTIDHEKLGQLLNLHQTELRERLKISTPKIDNMIDMAQKAGALGAKINGSGGGGCMFAYAPDTYEQVAGAILKAGGRPYIIDVGRGVSVDKLQQ